LPILLHDDGHAGSFSGSYSTDNALVLLSAGQSHLDGLYLPRGIIPALGFLPLLQERQYGFRGV